MEPGQALSCGPSPGAPPTGTPPQPFPHLLLSKVSRAPRPARRLPLTCGLCVSGLARPLSEPQVSPGDPACHEARPHTRGCRRACWDRSPTLWPAHGEGGLGLKRFLSTVKELSAPRLGVLCPEQSRIAGCDEVSDSTWGSHPGWSQSRDPWGLAEGSQSHSDI